jgi:hypothetical protein
VHPSEVLHQLIPEIYQWLFQRHQGPVSHICFITLSVILLIPADRGKPNKHRRIENQDKMADGGEYDVKYALLISFSFFIMSVC